MIWPGFCRKNKLYFAAQHLHNTIHHQAQRIRHRSKYDNSARPVLCFYKLIGEIKIRRTVYVFIKTCLISMSSCDNQCSITFK